MGCSLFGYCFNLPNGCGRRARVEKWWFDSVEGPVLSFDGDARLEMGNGKRWWLGSMILVRVVGFGEWE
ncbi:hypothetical protein V6N12_063859 [Hibiscus sabdariffa]|uniref:Uncharacterized protein n=1 Tax=Hibiscus sabdariffa TaxID=183260 RepID=A0ABR2ARP0_9ROSI